MHAAIRRFLCTAVALVALLAPAAALADDQGAVQPGQPAQQAQQAQQAQPPVPQPLPGTGDDASALAIGGTLVGLLLLAGVLIVVTERSRRGQPRPN